MSASCTARLLNPLLRLLATRNASLDLVPRELRSVAPQDRIPVDLFHDMLDNAVAHLGDAHLGLTLGRSVHLGELGPLDYLLRSAPTVRDAVEVAGRYSTLQAEGYRIAFESWRGDSLIRLHNDAAWPRSAGDMSLSAAYRLHVAVRARFTSKLECWFPYPAPADPSVHARCFAGAALRFGAPFFAFAVDASYTRASQPAADPALHALLLERAEVLLREVAERTQLCPRVRSLIECDLRRDREVSADRVARALRMSRRTLSRRLEQEGTTFAHELDRVRCALALSYVRESPRPFAEVALLLGFSHVESFYRAFKRWTGTTPGVQRTSARGRND